MDWLRENVTEITELNLNKITLKKLTVAYSIFLLRKSSLYDIWLIWQGCHIIRWALYFLFGPKGVLYPVSGVIGTTKRQHGERESEFFCLSLPSSWSVGLLHHVTRRCTRRRRSPSRTPPSSAPPPADPFRPPGPRWEPRRAGAAGCSPESSCRTWGPIQ